MRLVDLLSALRRPSRPSRSTTRLAVVSLAILAAYVSLKVSYVPFAWFFITWFLTLLYLGLSARGATSKTVWINLSAAVMALGMGELYIWNTTPIKTNSYCCNDAYIIPDDHFGMVPRKNFTATHVKTINSVPIYETTYTMDANGLRIAPPYDVRHVLGSALFFGCSFTIGEGVGDNEAMPYVTGLLTHGRYAIYNFGFHGYGPQQMLATLERGVVDAVVTLPPKYIIYQAIPYHLERVAGLMTWFPHAPRYRKTDSWRVTAQGNFDTVADETRFSRIEQFWRARGPVGHVVSTTLRKSFIYNKLASPFRSLWSEDVQLFLAIVTQARNAAALQYPDSEFHVILWDNMFRQQDFLRFLPQVLDGFRDQHVQVHLLSDIIPDYEGRGPNTKYELHLHDSHPNPFTHRLIAAYIAKNILRAN